jgi:hypothetical protein
VAICFKRMGFTAFKKLWIQNTGSTMMPGGDSKTQSGISCHKDYWRIPYKDDSVKRKLGIFYNLQETQPLIYKSQLLRLPMCNQHKLWNSVIRVWRSKYRSLTLDNDSTSTRFGNRSLGK